MLSYILNSASLCPVFFIIKKYILQDVGVSMKNNQNEFQHNSFENSLVKIVVSWHKLIHRDRVS